MKKYSRSSWISGKKLSQLRADIRSCPDLDYREEGLMCLRGRRQGEFLLNLIPQNHPDRRGLVRWLTSEDDEEEAETAMEKMEVEVKYKIVRKNATISVRATVAIVATGEVGSAPPWLSCTGRLDGVVTNYARCVFDDLAEARRWTGDMIETVAQYYAEYCEKLRRLQREIPDPVLVEIDQHGRWSGEV